MSGPKLHRYQVGALYHADRTRWDEGNQYNYRAGAHELLSFLRAPSAEEVRAYTDERWQFALLDKPEVLFLLYKPGTMPWSDAPYSWQRVRELSPAEATEPFELPTPSSRALLSVILVDAATGILRGLRALSFSPSFSRALHQAIRAQMGRHPALGEYDRAVTRYYGIYPSTKAMLAHALARCDGGD